MLQRIISKQFPVFPQSVWEVFYSCLIGFAFSCVLVVPLSFPPGRNSRLRDSLTSDDGITMTPEHSKLRNGSMRHPGCSASFAILAPVKKTSELLKIS
jgi:hypothetical protein